MQTVGRRKILGLVSAFLAGLPFAGTLRASPAEPPHPADRFLSVLDSVLPPGPAPDFLAADFRTVDDQRAALYRLSAGCPDYPAPGRDTLRRHMAKLIDADFAHGRLTNANGWMLSRTEADALCLVRSRRTG